MDFLIFAKPKGMIWIWPPFPYSPLGFHGNEGNPSKMSGSGATEMSGFLDFRKTKGDDMDLAAISLSPPWVSWK